MPKYVESRVKISHYVQPSNLSSALIAGYLHFDFHTYKSTDILPFQNSKESVSISNFIKKICSVNTLGTEVFGMRRLTKVVEGLLRYNKMKGLIRLFSNWMIFFHFSSILFSDL